MARAKELDPEMLRGVEYKQIKSIIDIHLEQAMSTYGDNKKSFKKRFQASFNKMASTVIHYKDIGRIGNLYIKFVSNNNNYRIEIEGVYDLGENNMAERALKLDETFILKRIKRYEMIMPLEIR